MNGNSRKKAATTPSSPPTSPADEISDEEVSRPLKSESPAAGLNDRWLIPGVCIFLAVITFAVFGQTLRHEFVNFDDGLYVYENPVVQKGLTLEGIVLAFTRVFCANWHPLTMMSHMLDCQFYGLSPGGHHLTNILLHTATAVLLFLVLRRMTGFLWRSAFVAAVFAIHPLRVESVAWVAERKDVLSGVFFMLTIWAYARYVQNQSRVESRKSSVETVPALDPGPWSLDYYLVLLFFALGLMSKPMVVTLPFVLLLLDYWPLGRISEFGVRPAHHSLWAKDGSSELKNTPQLPVATICRVETKRRREQSENGSTLGRDETERRRLNHLLLEKLPLLGLAVASCVVTIFAQYEVIVLSDKFSLPLRMGNALISYVAYLSQMFWPSDLAVIYPFTPEDIGVSKVVLSLGLLAGISGGVFVLRRHRPYLLTGWLWYLIMLVPVIGILQVGVQARADRYTYLPQIGLYLLLTWAAADLCAGWRYRRRVLGGCATVILVALIFRAHAQTSYWRNSELLWTHTLACTSDNAVAHNNLGNALFQKGNVDEAIVQYQKALQIKPDNVEAHINLGIALLKKGNVDEAITHFQTALQIKPDYAEAHINLADALLQKGKVGEAITHLQKTLQIKSDSLDALNNLAWLLATCPDPKIRDGIQAIQLAERACELTDYQKTICLGTLAAAYAEAGRFDDAITTAEKACTLAKVVGEQGLLQKNQELLELYRAHQPYHEPASPKPTEPATTAPASGGTEKLVPAAP